MTKLSSENNTRVELALMKADIASLKTDVSEIKGDIKDFVKTADSTYARKTEVESLRQAVIRDENKILDIILRFGPAVIVVIFVVLGKVF